MSSISELLCNIHSYDPFAMQFWSRWRLSLEARKSGWITWALIDIKIRYL